MQAAKKLYESLLVDDVNATALAHIQVRYCLLFCEHAYFSFFFPFFFFKETTNIVKQSVQVLLIFTNCIDSLYKC